MKLVLGMDIGGTHSRARLATADGTTVAEAEAPSASFTAAGQERAERAVDQLLAALGLGEPAGPHPGGGGGGGDGGGDGGDGRQRPDEHKAARQPLAAVCVGTAGSGSTTAVEWFVRRLAPLTTADKVIVVNDSRLALPAAGLDEGIAVISGTGSTAIGVAAGREERAGGWGYLLGDEGSGYWIAREGVREILRRHDDHDDLGPLGAALLDDRATGATDPLTLLHRFHKWPSPDRWARLAPLVLDSGDACSPVIANAAASALALLAASVAHRLLPLGDWRSGLAVVLAGGLMANHQELGERTKAAIESIVPEAVVRIAGEPPVAGAVRMALEAAGRALGR